MSTMPVPELTPLSVAPRLERLRARFAGSNIDGLLVTNLTNVRYLTGFAGSAGMLAVTSDRAILVTDGRYRTQSAEQMAAAGVSNTIDLAIGGGDAQRDELLRVLGSAERVGLEADSVTWAQAETWRDRLGRDLVASSGVVEGLREVKDAGEIDRMRHAAAIADAALREVLPALGATASSPLTEEAFALMLDSQMRRFGAESVAFETIVAAGENSAKPHHHPGSRVIAQGDPVVIDFGATFDGYRSDMTRTFVIGGEPEGQLAEIFATVAASQAAGVRAVQPGANAAAVDGVCRDLIHDAGYGDYFEHSTGHGVGLDIHEAPWVSSLGTAILEPGVVVTVEPGVYVAGVGGVRIEDTLVVTSDGAEALTKFTKDIAA